MSRYEQTQIREALRVHLPRPQYRDAADRARELRHLRSEAEYERALVAAALRHVGGEIR